MNYYPKAASREKQDKIIEIITYYITTPFALDFTIPFQNKQVGEHFLNTKWQIWTSPTVELKKLQTKWNLITAPSSSLKLQRTTRTYPEKDFRWTYDGNNEKILCYCLLTNRWDIFTPKWRHNTELWTLWQHRGGQHEGTTVKTVRKTVAACSLQFLTAYRDIYTY